MNVTNFNPISPKQRIQSIDVLRGFVVLGILIMLIHVIFGINFFYKSEFQICYLATKKINCKIIKKILFFK